MQGGGEMGELTRNYNWAAHALGAPEHWPQSLKTIVSMVLKARFPMFIWWGKELFQFYNDAYRPSLGRDGKHPKALGAKGKDTWVEIWPVIWPLIEGVMAGGDSTWSEDQLIPIYRNGGLEDVYWTFSYSRIDDDEGKPGGVLVTCTETTSKVVALQNLSESEARFRNMAESSDVLIAMSDESSNAVYFNKAWTDLTGKSMDDLLKFGWTNLIHPDDKERYVNIYLSAFKDKVSFTGEFRVLSKNGDYRWLLAKGPPRFNPDGSFAGYISSCVDITDRKNYEHHIELMLSMLPAHVVVIRGQDLVVETINQSNLSYWNRSKKETIGKPLLEILPELAYQPFPGQLQHVLNTGEVISVKESPVLFVDEDGTKRTTYVDYSYQPLTDANGNIISVLVMSFEVTDKVEARKQLENYAEEMQAINEELSAANEEMAATNKEMAEVQQLLQDTNDELSAIASRLHMAIETTSLGTWDYNPLSGELYWSKECRDIYGLSDEELPTYESFTEHILPDDRSGVEKAVQKAMDPSGDGLYGISYRILRFDNGETRWIKVQGTVYFDQARATRFIGTVLDITEMKAAEEKSAKLAAIITSSDDAIISKTLDSVITSWNDSAERIFGYTSAEMIGQTIYKLIPDDRQEEEPQILARLRTGERVEHFETKRRTKDGRLIDVSITVSPVKNNEGLIIGLSKIARDITEKKLDEARKNDFIGMVSHELKTPLTTLTALIQVLNSKFKNSEDAFVAGALDKASMQVKKMSTMINGFLNISRLESGKIMIDKHKFDLEKLIEEVIKETELTVSSHVIRFEPCRPVIINADHDKIGSVINNLISNAVKYSPKGKLIEVSCDIINNTAQVSVKDEGMGIKPQDIEQLFDRYYRVESNNTQHISGFGIGLYLSAEIIKRHNGKIWVESESGVGSTFYFSLPL